jgi:hypothetical protein
MWQNYVKSAISIHQLAMLQVVEFFCNPNPQNQITWKQRGT